MEKYGVSYQQVYSWVRKRSGNEAQSHTRRRVTTENQTVRRAESSPWNGGWSAKKVRRVPASKEEIRRGRYLNQFQAIKDYSDKNEDASISYLCRLLKVSPSGYYKWLHHEETASEKTNQELTKVIQELHGKYHGILGIRSIIRRSRGYCTKTSVIHIEENILNRDFTATAPNQKWCTDVTFLQYGLGCKAYLSAIKDLYGGSIVAYHISHHNDNPLVMENLRKAMETNPGATPLLHSDRGSQYTSREYCMKTTQYQITRSMSRVGKCIDNAPIESFFGHLKTECYNLKKYESFEGLVSDMDDYIYFYNHDRFQERNNGLAPLEMRNQAVA